MGHREAGRNRTNEFPANPRGVEQLLEPSAYEELCANAQAYENRALLEIPGFLDQILQRHKVAKEVGLTAMTSSALEKTALASITSLSQVSYA